MVMAFFYLFFVVGFFFLTILTMLAFCVLILEVRRQACGQWAQIGVIRKSTSGLLNAASKRWRWSHKWTAGPVWTVLDRLLFQDTTFVCVLTEIVTAHHPCLCFRWWWKVGTGWSGVTCRSWIRSTGMTGWISTAWLRLSSNRSSNRWMRVRAIFLLVLVWFLVFMQRWWETDSAVSECLESSPSLDNSVTSLHLLF